MTNKLATEKLLNALNHNVFLSEESNLLIKNLKSIFDATRLAHNAYLERMSDDMVVIFSFLFTNGNKNKAKSILAPQKSISLNQMFYLALFGGAILSQLLCIGAYWFSINAALLTK